MIVHNFDFIRIAACPAKTYAPLIIDADAVLPLTITRQFFQAVPWGDAKVFKPFRCVDYEQLTKGYSL